MAITAAEMIAGVAAAFSDAPTWARAMTRLALVEAINEQKGRIAQGQTAIDKRDAAEAAWLQTENAKLAALEAQLAALALELRQLEAKRANVRAAGHARRNRIPLDLSVRHEPSRARSGRSFVVTGHSEVRP